MPRGIPNKPKAPTAAPSPLILIQPGADGTEFNAYGLEHAQIVEELRRVLVYVVASQAGVRTISHTIRRNGATARAQTPPATAMNFDEETDL